MRDKYSSMNELTALGFLVNAMGGGGDRGQSFPRFIPGEVTLARRRGEYIEFVQKCRNQCCWYWLFPDGSRTYYWERSNWETIKNHHAGQVTKEIGEKGLMSVPADAMENFPCYSCGNPHTSGGHIRADGTSGSGE